MRLPSIVLLCLLAMLAWSRPAQAASSYDNCAGFITSVPAVISTAGTWCLKQDVTTAITGGTAITISADNITLDCNDFRIDGLAAGTASGAVGVGGTNVNNARVRHCNIRGFESGVTFDGGSRNIVEDNHLDLNIRIGLEIQGDGSVARGNVILNTGSLSFSSAGSPIGIHVNDTGTTDVIDNTINGVGSQCGDTQCGIGILVDTNSPAGANVVGNRIGGLPPNVPGANGIQLTSPGRVVVRENEIIGGGGKGTGVNCLFSTGGATIRVHDNVIDGFVTPIVECTDAGENDTSP